MKKIFFRISVLALILVGYTACDDKLDQDPFDEFGTDAAYEGAEGFENGIRGVYSGLTSGGLYGGGDTGGMLDAPDVLADNVTTAQKGRGTRRDLHNWRYVPSDNRLNELYNAAYTTIYRANVILDKIKDFEGVNKNNITAEARALRALAHMNVVSFFGKIPTQSSDANESLGIAYVTGIDPDQLPARETVGAVYDKIIDDLTYAAANINASNPDGRLNREAVNIILSRAYLYMGKNTEAIAAANNVTTKPAARDNMVAIWEDESRDGVLFYIPNEVGVLGIGVGVAWSQGGYTNLRPEYVVDYDFYTHFENDDIRKEAYIFEASNGGDQFNGIKKLLGRDGNTDGLVDIKILRAAEAYLNKAEAYFNAGNEPLALQALDEVRSRRYTSFSGDESGQALLDAIRLERRLEFAFESHRFFDLKRWGMSIERYGYGDLADGSGVPSDEQSLSSGSHKFQLPIPQFVLDRNENIQQNPGY